MEPQPVCDEVKQPEAAPLCSYIVAPGAPLKQACKSSKSIGSVPVAAKCRNCGNSGVDFLGDPCTCPAGLQQPEADSPNGDVPASNANEDIAENVKAHVACSVCGGASTGMKADGSMQGAPCKACCKVTLRNGHIGIAGSIEMPTVLEFEGHDERLFVWRYRKAWCVKPVRPRPSPDAATAPKVLGNAKIPAPPKTDGEWTEPELQKWREVSSFYADACLKAGQPRVRSCTPARGNPSPPTFAAKTVEMGRKMKEPAQPNAAFRPGGVAPAWGETGPNWGSWGAPWGQQPLSRSISLPTLRSGPPAKVKRKNLLVKTKELGAGKSTDDKELRFVAHAINEGVAKPEASVSLEEAMEARQNDPWKKTKPKLPVGISALIGYGDILFEPPADECSTMASGSMMSMPMTSWEESRSALRDDSMSFLHDFSCDTVHLPDITPKAKLVKSTGKASTAALPPKNETRAAAEKRGGRELVQASWKMQQNLSQVKVSIGHMLL